MADVDDWYDWWRVLNAIICASATLLLLVRFKMNHHSYNTKTVDIWFAFLVWTFTGFISSLEGIYYDSPMGPRAVLVSFGAVVTFVALLRRGSWGYSGASNSC